MVFPLFLRVIGALATLVFISAAAELQIKDEIRNIAQVEIRKILSDAFRNVLTSSNPVHFETDIKSILGPQLSAGAAAIVLPNDPDFKDMNARFSEYRRPTYIAAVKVATEQDVVSVQSYARARNIPYLARSGGHSLTTSLGAIQNAIMIDMRGLNQVKFDSEKMLVTVGGGTATGELANASYYHGVEVTVGSCPCTGVLGVAFGAGIGRLQGKYGYLQDNMVSARLLLANSTIIEVSEEKHPDIFWSIRGAGHNMGLGLEATFRVYPQKNKGLHYAVDLEFDLDQLEDVFEAMNKVSPDMPAEQAFFVIARKKGINGKPTINVNWVWAGPKEDAQDQVAFWKSLHPVFFEDKVVNWAELPWAVYAGLNNELCTPKGWSRYPLKSFYAANVKEYDIPTMRDLFDTWNEMGQKYNGTVHFEIMFESFPQQGVRARPDESTAYPWRWGSDHFLMFQAAFRDPHLEAELDAWLKERQALLIKTSGYGRLQQYVNYGHGSGHDPVESLYGYEPWRLEKLGRVKAALDPEHHFSGYQPLPKTKFQGVPLKSMWDQLPIGL